jgi:hypothetical protein
MTSHARSPDRFGVRGVRLRDMADEAPIGAPIEHDDHLPGTLVEYGALREELLWIERSRLLALAFAIVAVAALGGFGVRYDDTHALTGVAALALIVLAAGALLTTRQTERLQLIHVYLARYVEPLVPGMKWEQRRLELEQLTRLRADEATIAALLYLGGVAATLIVYFGDVSDRPLYGEVGIPAVAAAAVAASLRLLAVGGGDAGRKRWDRFETVALLGTDAMRPLLLRVRGFFRRRRLERLGDGAPDWARPSVELPHEVIAAASGDLTPGALKRLSGLTNEELETVMRAEQLDALWAVVEVLAGGLGAEATAEWLRSGAPSRLENLKRGAGAPVVAEARDYVGLPPKQL